MTIGTAFLIGWLQVHGYGAPQRAAVLHHARIESNFRPDAISPSRTHFGLWQWAGSRKLALFRYALKRHLPWSDPTLQLEFMNHEAHSLPGMTAFWRATTAREAINIFCTKFEKRRRCAP